MLRILSLDGGGGKGLIEAEILVALEGHIRTISGKPMARIADYADLIAGTSTGGIIACALASPEGLGAIDIRRLYGDHIPEVFRSSVWRRLWNLNPWGLRDERYSSAGLERLLITALGLTRLNQCVTRLLVPAWDLERGELHLFRSWSGAAGIELVSVARATSAAPTYFEPAITAQGGFIDGGIVANNPALRAYTEARMFPGQPTAKDMLVVSIGAGRVRQRYRARDARHWGLAKWARPLVGLGLSGSVLEVDAVLRSLFDAAGAPNRYVRVQPDLTGERSEVQAMDSTDARTLARWQEIGQAAAEDHRAELLRVARLMVEAG